MRRAVSFLALLVALMANFSPAAEIGYIEKFALSEDRTEALKQLIPGTQDYYYFNCLHLQNTERFDQVDEMLANWIKRYGYTPQVWEIKNRQALLTYTNNSQKSLEYIRGRLNINFNHQRETLNKKPNLPTELNQNLISRESLSKRAFADYRNLQDFENAALDWLVAAELNPDDRRHLLQRLQRPDYPNLPKLIVADLDYKNSSGFGSFDIHRLLLLSQLDELLKLKPTLLNQSNFVNTYLSKLHPNDDVDWLHNPAEHEAYLDRMAQFVRRLAPVHNSLKACVLYHRLVFDRSQGIYDKDRFMEYIKLPRDVGYMNADFMKVELNRRYLARLATAFDNVTLLPAIGSDYGLVCSYLQHFFVKETTYAPYEPYIRDTVLKHEFAEAKIVNGLGEPEKWYSLLPPEKNQQLKDRIDLEFAFTNRKQYTPDDPVSVDLFVKNVKTLLVKVYEISADNYYREHLREVDTDIQLDGLVANHEAVHKYAEPPLRRVKRHFDFPTLDRAGVFVIDFIGNGKSSRVLLRKGKLRYLVRTSVAGQIFTVLDDENQKVKDATISVAGHEYEADKDGYVTVPFSNRPGRQPIILSRGNFSSLDHFDHQSENYSFVAGIYVDRESLLKRKKSNVIVRPGLLLNGTPITLSILKNPTLVITSTDLDGVATTKEVKDFGLFEDRESTYEFQVPQRLSAIQFTVKAKVKNLSRIQEIELAASDSFSLNQIDRSEKVEDLHFAKMNDEYVIELFGRTGEPKVDRPVQISVKHRDFRRPVNVTLKTDPRGRIVLGELRDIAKVTATGPESTSHSWALLEDRHTYSQTLHGRAGQNVTVPFMGDGKKPDRNELSLLEVRGVNFVADRFEALSIKNGLIEITGLGAGDYDLWLKNSGRRIRIRITDGDTTEGYVVGANRRLEARGKNPLQIKPIAVNAEKVSIQLRGHSKFARVHIFATRYQPAYSAYGSLARVGDVEPYAFSAPIFESLFVAGRNIGDEYRYIIDRKYATKFPGNMLNRPSLLLNPWAIRKTETSQQDPAAGDDFGGEGGGMGGGGFRGPPKKEGEAAKSGFANLNFLADASAVLINIEADKDGKIEIDRDMLVPHQSIHVVAVDPRNTVYRSISLPESEAEFADLRLIAGLDPEKHYTQQKQISIVGKNQEFVISDIATSKFEVYDDIARVYSLYATLSENTNLVDFGFVRNWLELKPAEKQEKYSKYACHELNYFLSRKDPEFFKQSIQPYLENKKDKTYLDQWLVENELVGYRKPWSYAQLNIVEQALLGRRINGEQPWSTRHIRDQFDLLPPNIERFNHLFHTALKGSSLDADDDYGLDDALAEVEEEVMERSFAAKGESKDQLKRLNRPAMPKNAPASPPPTDSPDANGRRELRDLGRKAAEKESDFKKKRARDGKAGFKAAGVDKFYDEDFERRERVRQFYRKLDKTQEWVENNYYHLPIEQQNADLVKVNAFWNDFAAHEDGEYFSTNLAEASNNFTEMMFALAALDLPFEAGEHKTEFDGAKMTLTPAGPGVIYHEEIMETKDIAEDTPILVSQNFFRHGDRYRHENNERLDKYVTDEFLVHTVYGCQIVVTNPTSSRQKLDLLLQVPIGAIPVMNGQYTRSVHTDLQPYNTQTIEYYFYFPQEGQYAHYPVHVAKHETLVAFVEPATLKVVREPSKIDTTSWDYISQFGTADQVVDYLQQNNLHRTNLGKIAFRMQDKAFFEKIVALLTQRHAYNHTLWSYGIKHNVPLAVREYLQHANGFVNQCGAYIDSPLVTIDPGDSQNVPAHGLQTARQFPRASTWLGPPNPQRSLPRTISSFDESTQLSPRLGRCGINVRHLLHAPAGPRRRSTRFLWPRERAESRNANAIRLLCRVPGFLFGGTRTRAGDCQALRRSSGRSLAKRLRQHHLAT